MKAAVWCFLVFIIKVKEYRSHVSKSRPNWASKRATSDYSWELTKKGGRKSRFVARRLTDHFVDTLISCRRTDFCLSLASINNHHTIILDNWLYFRARASSSRLCIFYFAQKTNTEFLWADDGAYLNRSPWFLNLTIITIFSRACWKRRYKGTTSQGGVNGLVKRVSTVKHGSLSFWVSVKISQRIRWLKHWDCNLLISLRFNDLVTMG